MKISYIELYSTVKPWEAQVSRFKTMMINYIELIGSFEILPLSRNFLVFKFFDIDGAEWISFCL